MPPTGTVSAAAAASVAVVAAAFTSVAAARRLNGVLDDFHRGSHRLPSCCSAHRGCQRICLDVF